MMGTKTMDWRADEVLGKVDAQVRKWHEESADACMREWFYKGHVAVVADWAAKIAAREGADVRVAVLAALLHDVARTEEVEGEPALTERSEAMARGLMQAVGVSAEDIAHVCGIMKIHSCRGEDRPETLEGKAMVTADAMAHVMTGFYLELPFHGWLTAADDFEGYKAWVLEKTRRDLHKKIFFEAERELAGPRVGAFGVLFGD